MKSVIGAMRETWRQQLAELRDQIPVVEEELRAMKQAERDLARQLRDATEATTVTKTKSPSGAVVRPIVLRLLGDNQRLTAAEVYDLVHDEITNAGYDAKGLQLRVNEALKAESIDEVEAGVFSIGERLKVS